MRGCLCGGKVDCTVGGGLTEKARMAEEYAVGLRVSRGVGGMTDQLAGCGFGWLGGWVRDNEARQADM